MKINGYHFKEDLYYSKKHVWVKRNGQKVVLGLDDYFVRQLATIADIELTYIDNELEKDDAMATIYCQGEILEVFPPFSGKVTNVNEKLEEEPEIMIEDPYGEGWLIEMEEISDEEFDRLYKDEKAEDWFHQEVTSD